MTVESDYLRSYPCFQDLTDVQLDKVAQFSVAECFFPGHILFEDGAPGEQIYLLAKGEVEILFALGENSLALVDRLGGTHLNTASDAYLAHVIGVIRERYPALHLYLNHCMVNGHTNP